MNPKMLAPKPNPTFEHQLFCQNMALKKLDYGIWIRAVELLFRGFIGIKKQLGSQSFRKRE
jgi:hypothetical protein